MTFILNQNILSTYITYSCRLFFIRMILSFVIWSKLALKRQLHLKGQNVSIGYGLYSLNFHHNFSIFFGKSWHNFLKVLPICWGRIQLRIIEISNKGRWKWSSIFHKSHHSQKICFQKLWSDEKKTSICQKVLMKIDEMTDVFLNSANFAQHAFFTLV